MNEDERFARVRVRRRLLPLLETFNPRAAEALSRAAGLLREDSAALDRLASELLERAGDKGSAKGRAEVVAGGGGPSDESFNGVESTGESFTGVEVQCEEFQGEELERDSLIHAATWPLRVDVLRAAMPALRRRALRLWLARGRGLRRLGLAHLAGVERLLEGARGGRVAELPGGGRVERRRGLLIFVPKNVEKGRVET
jgi:tRNA(Ile)-lysidine synthase